MANVLIDENTMTGIADAIREKAGNSTTLLPSEMPDAIANITTGPDIEVVPLTVTENGIYTAPEGQAYTPIDVAVPTSGGDEILLQGNCNHALSAPAWTRYDGKILTKDITDMQYMFYNLQSQGNVFKDMIINVKDETNYNMQYLFAQSNRTEFPKIVLPQGFQQIYYGNQMFYSCNKVTTIPDDMFPVNIPIRRASSMFYNCYNLLKLPEWFIKADYSNIDTSYSPYNQMCLYCYSIEEITLPVVTTKVTSSMFSRFCNGTCHCKKITFSPYDGVLDWSNQSITFDTNNRAGSYNSSPGQANWYDYGHGQIKDDATYALYKDSPNAWTSNTDYAFFNLAGLIPFIESLPQVSGTKNTITLLRTQGQKTDGGALGDLPDEKIALATERGWTVTFK